MKKVTTILTVIAITLIATISIQAKDNTGSIQFHDGDWNEILKQAKIENKPIFVDISATWCGYCKKMKSKVYTKSSVADYYNHLFINVSLDGEKGIGAELAEKYNVQGYPTFVFINPDGSLAEKSTGYHNTDQFIELGKLALE